ncbi:MAG: formylglycine-generating enzyme family protein [Calothrix sp. SM1_5_4]|nr:formylglycine-generating enzyme family protein [Calothrix sp. SM1_5_4]
MDFLEVPGGIYRIGTTAEGVQVCVQEWKSRLINSSYDENSFRKWIEKEFPAHETVVATFDLQQTLVCNGQVKNFLEESGVRAPESITTGLPDDHPVWGVSLGWATSFATWVSRKDPQYLYRLPTETEWEVAARGSDFREYPYGNKFDPRAANTRESGHQSTTPICAHANYPGPFGHYDLAGNVEEWVSTKYVIYPAPPD